jgi:hypothetical protein
MTAQAIALFAVSCLLPAQSMRVGGNGEKAWLVIPMTGSGTWADPKRPALLAETGVPFRFQLSDDGTMGPVELSPRNAAEFRRVARGIQSLSRVTKPW